MTAPYPPLTGAEPCRTVPADVFFPEPGRNAEADRAAQLCRPCPALLPCLAYAVANNVDGIWAGTSPKQRQQLRRMGRAAA